MRNVALAACQVHKTHLIKIQDSETRHQSINGWLYFWSSFVLCQQASNGRVPDIQMRFALRLGFFPRISLQFFSVQKQSSHVGVVCFKFVILVSLGASVPSYRVPESHHFQSTYHIKEHTTSSHIFFRSGACCNSVASRF